MTLPLGLELAERGMLPIGIVRAGIKALLRQRIASLVNGAPEEEMREALSVGRIALQTATANEQHYELPPEYFQIALGPYLKYSSGYWPQDVTTLEDAEERMLELTCERADLRDGQDILDLGCGWGSLSLFAANRFPNSRILSVSNSTTQRGFIEARAPGNVSVETADINEFRTERRFDRVVSVEMFEHMRNYRELLARIRTWMKPDARLFVHIFCHKNRTYEFETEGTGNWMGRHFFTAGLMPSYDLLPRFNDHFRLEQRWQVSGEHYQRTAAHWRANLEHRKKEVIELFDRVYGNDAGRWYHRWRIFFLACEELFGYDGGKEWFVGHFRFSPVSESH